MNSLAKHIYIFLGLITIQVLVLNQINLFGLVNPYIFPAFILLIPFQRTQASLILIGFALGLLIDFFNGTMGMHAFACTLMAFLRPYFIENFESKTDKFTFPSLKNNGLVWMLTYITSLLSVHHFAYFLIEAGGFSNFLHTFILTILSLFFSVFIIFLLLFIFKSSKR